MSMARQLSDLQRLGVKELRGKFAEVFGEAANANNRDWLVKRIAWRLQALAEGGLSERATQRAAELANDADLRVVPPRQNGRVATAMPPALTARPDADHRLPPPGTVITRPYKGDDLQVKVLTKGFEFEGKQYTSLSAVAKAVTGSHCNGSLFFRVGLNGPHRQRVPGLPRLPADPAAHLQTRLHATRHACFFGGKRNREHVHAGEAK